ncbi:uncharacterized G-patch domain protein DDB_G0278987-like [Helianthus annuus]|uniref:uncharacterized G-patch domain protein DDB_G0278987-like n=1 Tax=Helianthus annuus TaxID=4232 RepID=UPI000B8F9EC0|nr:uncharacterized G-patch domain protein DDB_G0278987-like [Helianthus annuus]
MELDVIAEIDKRIRVCLATKRTYKMETKEISKKEESSSESVCTKCEKSEADNIKLLKNVESLTLEIQALKDEKKVDEKQILEIQENSENLKSENNDKSSKTDSSDTNLRTNGVLKKEKVVNQKINKTKKVKFSLPRDEFVSPEIKEPVVGNDLNSSMSKEPCSGDESGDRKVSDPVATESQDAIQNLWRA